MVRASYPTSSDYYMNTEIDITATYSPGSLRIVSASKKMYVLDVKKDVTPYQAFHLNYLVTCVSAYANNMISVDIESYAEEHGLWDHIVEV